MKGARFQVVEGIVLIRYFIPALHFCVTRPTSPLWRRPANILERIFDVARLAVNAISLKNLIHPRRAIALLRAVIKGKVVGDGKFWRL
jgi:hypothetical protein